MTPEDVRRIVAEEMGVFFSNDRYIFQRELEITNGRDIILGEGVGTKIGTSATQKLGFYGDTPIVKPSALTSAVGGTIDGTWGSAEETEMINMRTRIAELESTLQSLGLLT